jgi:hypothetical protein
MCDEGSVTVVSNSLRLAAFGRARDSQATPPSRPAGEAAQQPAAVH